MESITYGTQAIDFHLARAERKTLGIEVHPDLSVWAIAPVDSQLEDVKLKLEKRSAWIVKQKKYFEQFLPRTPEREYVAGETHNYLGKRYLLNVKSTTTDSVKLKAGVLMVTSKGKISSQKTRALLTEWYYEHAKKRFEKEFKQALLQFQFREISEPRLVIRRMKNRWGSCTPSGKIIINPELIKAPSKCIEYVFIHEFCHLVHPNHGKEFYSLLESILPEWERWKITLEKFMC